LEAWREISLKAVVAAHKVYRKAGRNGATEAEKMKKSIVIHAEEYVIQNLTQADAKHPLDTPRIEK
jgi:hypothetical protein